MYVGFNLLFHGWNLRRIKHPNKPIDLLGVKRIQVLLDLCEHQVECMVETVEHLSPLSISHLSQQLICFGTMGSFQDCPSRHQFGEALGDEGQFDGEGLHILLCFQQTKDVCDCLG